MRTLPRAAVAAALLLGAFGAVPAASAEGGTCAYYKWNFTTERWERVAVQPEERFEKELGNIRGRDYDCKYCVPVSGIVPNPPDGSSPYDTVDDALAVVRDFSSGLPYADTVSRLAHSAGNNVEGTVDELTGDLEVTVNPWGNPPGCPELPPEEPIVVLN